MSDPPTEEEFTVRDVQTPPRPIAMGSSPSAPSANVKNEREGALKPEDLATPERTSEEAAPESRPDAEETTTTTMLEKQGATDATVSTLR